MTEIQSTNGYKICALSLSPRFIFKRRVDGCYKEENLLNLAVHDYHHSSLSFLSKQKDEFHLFHFESTARAVEINRVVTHVSGRTSLIAQRENIYVRRQVKAVSRT